MTSRQTTYLTFALGFVAMAGGFYLAGSILANPILTALMVGALALGLYLSHVAKGRSSTIWMAVSSALVTGVSARAMLALLGASFG